MIKGLNHFKIKQENPEESIAQFEIENDIIFPKLYRLFIKTYEERINLPLADDPNYGLRSLYDFKVNSYPDMVHLDFIEYKNSEEKFDAIFDGIDAIDTNEMFLIGTTPLKEGLFVGLTDEFCDKIFLYNHTDEIQFKILANDIFEFVSHFESKLHNRNEKHFKTEILYKKWGDEFWQVKSSINNKHSSL